jgi:putative SOS response-associated peptidase YedK
MQMVGALWPTLVQTFDVRDTRCGARSRSGRCSNTFLSLCRIQRCTGASPNTSRIAFRSAFDPSITNSIPSSGSSPLSTRSDSSAVATVAFSVDPSHSPSGTFAPSVVIPSATMFVRPFSSIPSSISTAKRMSSKRRAISSPSALRVRWTNAREIDVARWGLLPHWAKDERISYKLINARAETLLEKPAFRSLIGKYRCLVVADGFYEWTIGRDGKKQPIHFRLQDGSPFGFAGLWTGKTDDQGELVESCTVITTSPNELVAPVHDRMPVILSVELEQEWLDPEISKEHALSLLQAYPAETMNAVKASPLVNSVRNDHSGLLELDEPVALAS